MRLDQVAALAILMGSQLQLWSGSGHHQWLGATLGAGVVSLAVAFRRRWPLGSLMVFLAGWTAQTFLRHGHELHAIAAVKPALLLLFYGMGAFAARRRAYWGLGAAVVIGLVDSLNRPGGSPANAPVVVFLLTLPFFMGRIVRARAIRARLLRENAERLDAQRELNADTAASRERMRIARELHDVITHCVSVMVVQAGAARMVMDAQPSRAEESLSRVEQAGRDALAEMRRLVGVLGESSDERALSPQPGLADLDELMSTARASGLNVALSVEGEPLPVPPALDLCAYRILQEAVTNAIKHAAPARTQIRVRWTGAALELEVSDDGRRRSGPHGHTTGHGLAGMRERVAIYGGRLDAGHDDTGGFVVRASLPIPQGTFR